MFETFFEPRTFVLFSVITLASQHSESVWVGGGGENDVCETMVRSSRSYCVTTTSSQAPLAVKLFWNSFVTVTPV